MKRLKRAIITGGGTTVPFDAIRSMGNFSSGDTAVKIARELQNKGVQVTLIGTPVCLSKVGEHEGIKKVEFGTYKSLNDKLQGEIVANPPDFIFMAAAVSDFEIEPFDGKIASDQTELKLKLIQLPKMLDSLRKLATSGFHCGL